MIVVLLKGGLGNQMFQYAAGRRLAHKRNTSLALDLSWFENAEQQPGSVRTYELGDFNVKERFINHSAFVLARPEAGLKIKVYKYTKGLFKPRLTPYIKPDDEYRFDERVLNLPNNTFLEGFWQGPRYFENIRDLLLKDFSYKKPPVGKNKELADKIAKVDSISVHVRRGDYANNKYFKGFHGLTELDYYQRAIDKLAGGVKQPHFFVFSDEPKWCEKNLKINFPVTYVSHNKSGSEDLRLMMNCQHNIIANSSFSWWGAWLNQNPNKIVIAPKRWFLNKKANAEIDILPKEWLRI